MENNVSATDHTKSKVNVSNPERILSGVAGAVLVYQALKEQEINIPKALSGSFLVLRALTGHCPAYSAIGKKSLPDPVKNINIRTSVTVNKPRHEVYAFWRRLENLPSFMKHLESVEAHDSHRSSWKARIPGGVGTISWDAEVVKDEPGEFLGWSSLPGADIENAGKVEFLETSAGTKLNVVITYRPPMGALGAGAAKLLNGTFEKMVRQDIANFKQFIETGSLPEMEESAAEAMVAVNGPVK